MAQPYCPGPIFIYPGIAAGKRPVFLGTGEEGAAIEIIPAWEEVRNDITGSRYPLDRSYQGERAFIRVDLTRWNHDVYLALAAKPNAAGTPGFNPFGSIGTLIRTENVDYSLWIRFPYATLKPAMATLPPGYRFSSCALVGPDNLRPLGTKPKKISLIWIAEQIFNPTTGGLLLYDFNMANLPDVN